MKEGFVVQRTTNKNDEYYTPAYAVKPILKYLKPESVILCPFDTKQSEFVKLLKREGHTVYYSHIDLGMDFFDYTKDFMVENKIDYIISNPPFSQKNEVFEHLYKLETPFAMLIGVVGLFESQRRFEMFKNNKFEIMYLNKRVSFFSSHDSEKPDANPPFSSVYLTSNVLPKQVVFEVIDKNDY